MFILFAVKRMNELVTDLKFIVIFVLGCLLFTMSTASGYLQYRQDLAEYDGARADMKTTMAESGSYVLMKQIGVSVHRPPEPLGIFFRGAETAIGQRAITNSIANVEPIGSRNGLHPLFAAFGDIDFGFLFHTVFALFALLLAYDTVSGERERGMLKLIFSNSISRASVILGSAAGGIITLWLACLIPLLLSLLTLLLLFDISFSGGEWLRLVFLFGGNFLYLGVMYLAGVCISALNRTSFNSFLYSLALWVLCIGIIPVFAMEIAVRLSPAPSIDTLEAQIAAMQRENAEYHRGVLDSALRDLLNREVDRKDTMALITLLDRAKSDAARTAQERFLAAEANFFAEYQRQHLALAATAKNLSRLSPASVINFYSNQIAGTDESLQSRFLEALRRYRTNFIDYTDDKGRENPELTRRRIGRMISWNDDPETGIFRRYELKFFSPTERIDVADAPAFVMNARAPLTIISSALPDLLLLLTEAGLLLGLSIIFFHRYDVR